MDEKLTMEQAHDVASRVVYRQQHFGEALETSVLVVLLNFGDGYTPVGCIAGEWSGRKSDLAPGSGIPRCPNGHVLMESSSGRKGLALVDLDPAGVVS